MSGNVNFGRFSLARLCVVAAIIDPGSDDGVIEQKVIIKERLAPIAELPTSDAQLLDDIVDTLVSAKEAMAGLVTGKAEDEKPEEFKFRYYFEQKPDNAHSDIELLLRSIELQPLMAHHWELHSFRKPTSCSQCNKFIFGLTKQGREVRRLLLRWTGYVHRLTSITTLVSYLFTTLS